MRTIYIEGSLFCTLSRVDMVLILDKEPNQDYLNLDKKPGLQKPKTRV